MDQKVLYSMMGLAALPVVQTVAQNSYSWTGTQMSIGEGAVVSDDSSKEPTSYNIGKLKPGKYTLSCNLTSKVYNVSVAVSGAKESKYYECNNPGTEPQEVGIAFEVVDDTKDITISFTSSDPGETGAGFSFDVPKVSLNFNFTAIKNILAEKANNLASIIGGYNYAAKQEDVDAANALKTKAENIAESYKDYEDYKLYSTKSTIQEDIDELGEKALAAEKAYQNEQAYNRVNAAITSIKAKYNAAVAELETVLVDLAGYLLDDAKAKLNTDINEKITTASSDSYASYQAGSAVDDEATNMGKVPTEEALNNIVNDYKTQATTNQNAYNTLFNKVTTLQAALDAVEYADNNAAITAAFKTEREAAQADIDALKTKIEAVKNTASQLTLNVDSEEAAAQDKVNTLAGKVNTANAEYNANKATVAAIAKVQKKLDDAKTAVNKKVSADGSYKARDFYADYVNGVQAKITKFSTDAAAAYKADGTGTARTYNNNLSTTAVETEISNYQTNAIAAVNKYDALQTAIASYTKDLTAARAKMESMDVYTDPAYDYKTKLDLINKRINDIKKAITAARAEKGADHWTDMLAIDADAAIATDIAALVASVQGDQNEFDANNLATGITELSDKITAFKAKVADDSKVGDDFGVFATAEGEIETAYNAVLAAKGAIDVNSDNVDYKGNVGTTADDWKLADFTHNGGNRNKDMGEGLTMAEQWGRSTDPTYSQAGKVLYQKVTGIPNGIYTVELYAFAADQKTGYANNGKTDIAYVYANGIQKPVTVMGDTEANIKVATRNNPYKLENVAVTDGTLEMGLLKSKGGTNWHGIQIKSLNANTASLIQGWGAKITELNAQQTALETAANDVAAKVTANSSAKSTNQTNIDNLQTSMTTFGTTYKVGQDETPLGLSGKGEGAIKKEFDAINTALGDLETSNSAVVVTKVSNEDKTSAVGTKNTNWLSGDIKHNNNPANNPEVSAGDLKMIESWNPNTDSSVGTLLVQTVNNLPNGVYDIELYAYALQGSATPGSTTNAYVFANGKTTPVAVSPKNGDDWPQNLGAVVAAGGLNTCKIENVIVSDGSLTMGIAKAQGGTHWHGIQIKSLTYHQNTSSDLATYNTQYSALASRKSKLDTDAATAKDKVKKNADTNTAATKAVTDLQAAELATLKSLKNVTNANAVSDDYTAMKGDPANFKVFKTGLDADKSYTARKAAIDADITAMSDAIAASYAAETLTADWKNNSITVVTGKDKSSGKDITKTYSIATITTAINQLKADAVKESNNYEAYKALQDNNMSKLLPDTITVDATVTGEGALAYYQGLKDQYINDKAAILTRMEKSLTDREAVADKSQFITDIQDLINKVKVVKSNAVANLKKYNEQKSGDFGYEKTQTLWNNTYTEIAALNHSKEVQTWLDKLDKIQVELTASTQAVEANYPKGESVAKAQDFAAIQVKINTVKQQEAEGYNSTIVAENEAAHASFNTAIQQTTQVFSNAVADRAKYSSSNADLEDAINTAAAALDEALYTCPTDIQDLTTAENTAFTANAAANSALAEGERYTGFDVSQFNADALIIEQDITAKLNTFKEDVQAAIGGFWSGKQITYTSKVTSAESDINDYSDDAKKDAFKDVKDLIAKGDAGVASITLSEVEEAIASLENIKEMLSADKNKAAVKDLTPRFDEAETLYTTVKTYIEGVTIADDVKQNQLESLENAYNDLAYAKTLRKTAKNRDTIKSIIDNFNTMADNAKTAVETAVADDVNNTKAYNEMIADINSLSANLEEAETLAAQYKYKTSFETENTSLENLTNGVNDAKKNGSAVSYQTDEFGIYKDVLEAAINRTLTTAFGNERSGLAADITELKNQYNAYVAANGLNATANAFKADIDALEKALNEADDPADGTNFNDIKAATEALIRLQGDIADKETELLAANASTANAEVLADFNSQLDKLAETASLDDYDEWVGQQTTLNGKTLDEQITALNEQIAELKAAIAAEENISFYKDQYQDQIDAIEAKLTPVAEAITAKDAQFKANAAAYERLTAEVNELQRKIDAAKEKVGAYEFAANTYLHYIQYYYDGELSGGVQYDLNNAKSKIESSNASKSLDENSSVDNKTYIESRIQEYLDESAYKELDKQISRLNTNLSYSEIIGGIYSQAVTNRLVIVKSNIKKEINNFRQKIDYSYQTYEFDEYGNYINKARTSDADYADQIAMVQPIQDKIDSLNDAIGDMILLGDANENGRVDVLDYRLVANMILDPSRQPDPEESEHLSDLFHSIDVNGNEVIEVGDLTAIVNYILNKDWLDYAAEAGVKAEYSAEHLSMTASELPTGVQRFAVNLENFTDYTAFQLDVVLPEGMSIVGMQLSERAGESHQLMSRTQADGSVRLLASSIKGEVFGGNNGAVVYIDLKNDGSYKGGSVELVNVLFSSTNFGTRAFSLKGEATGISLVETLDSLKQKVYDLSGRLANGLKKGINIIRRADGSTQKVMK